MQLQVMKFLSCLIVALACTISATAQSDGCMQMTITQPLQFDFDNIQELRNGKTIRNAVEITLKPSVENNLYVYASISFAGLRIPAELRNAISLRLAYTNHLKGSQSRIPVHLSQTPVLLFTCSSEQVRKSARTYVFDVVVDPIARAPVTDCSFTINAGLYK